jgi:hypothetical protein
MVRRITSITTGDDHEVGAKRHHFEQTPAMPRRELIVVITSV